MDVTLSFDDFRLGFISRCLYWLLAHSGADGGDRECSHRAGLLQGLLPCEAGSAGLFHVLTLFFLLIVLTLVLLMRSNLF